MAGAKIVVLYPRPTDVAEFERLYVDEHMPIVDAKIGGLSKVIYTTVVGAAGGDAPYHRITELHFPSMAALQQSMGSASTQEAAAHAVAISTGGAPIFLIAEDANA
jgi:uncharacterized protein (TIGR02118 family)